MIRQIFFLFSAFYIVNISAHLLLVQPTDAAFQYRFEVPQSTYHKYCKNIYSQNGEDGILEQLMRELGIVAGTFCEFGASDGITSSNTYNLIKNYNFSGIAIELDKARYERCVANYRSFPNVQV